MTQDPDFELIRRCQSGASEKGRASPADAEAAFEELFGMYRDRVFNLAARLLGNLADAEDVTQEAFVTVFRKIDDFRYSSRFYTWLYRVVYNLCMDYRRRSGSMPSVGQGGSSKGGSSKAERSEAEDGVHQLSDPRQGPLETLAEGEYQIRSVERALERLSEPLRAVVMLRYMEDLPYAEIAEVLGCSVGTVKSRLSRAHAFMQQIPRSG